MELTVVMPCLNEAETVATCIPKAIGSWQRAASRRGDRRRQRQHRRLQAIAANAGPASCRQRATAPPCSAASAARGRYVIMGDADDSYDFTHLMPFVDELREGADLVMGNRFQGGIAPGRDAAAASVSRQPRAELHRPHVLPQPIGDFHCGLRGFRRDACCARSAGHRHGVRQRDGRQGDAPRQHDDRGADHPAPRTAAAARRTCVPGATAGGTCAFCCCSARAGCSSCPASSYALLGMIIGGATA